MKILFADAVEQDRLEPLHDAGHDVEVNKALSAGDLPSAMAGVNVLVVRSTKVTAETIDAASDLGLIVRAGAGTDNIDKPAASDRGIYVCNVPGRNAIAVAELTMGLLLGIDRRIPDNVAELRAGTWNKALYTKADGVFGKTIGIVGLGDIGLAVAERAKCFGMRVVSVRRDSRSATTRTAIRTVGIRMVDTLAELAEQCDVVSIHVPKAADTVGLIDRDFIEALPDGAMLINTARADVIDNDALFEALQAGRIRAGLDVWPDEPSGGQGDFRSELASHPAVVGTHHIGASTLQAQQSVSDGTVAVIEAYLAGRPVNCVNMRVDPSGSCTLSIRHRDEVGVLAQIFDVLRSGGLNVQQMENRVFDGGGAAVADINVDRIPTPDILDGLDRIQPVIKVSVLRQQ